MIWVNSRTLVEPTESFHNPFESSYFQFTVSQLITSDILTAFIFILTPITKSILGLPLYIQSTQERFLAPWAMLPKQYSKLNLTKYYLEATKSISNQTCSPFHTRKIFAFILIHGGMRRSIYYLTMNSIHTKNIESSTTWELMDSLPISVEQPMMR